MADNLEKLPNELQSLILHEVPEGSIQSLLHAAPSYRRRYFHERDLLLADVDTGLLVDIFAMFQAVDVRNKGALRKEKRQALLAFLAHLDQEEIRSTLPQLFTFSRLSTIPRFHQTIQLLVEDFLQWTWGSSTALPAPLAAKCQDMPLSSEENLRLFRAFYRVQLYCNLYGISMNYGEMDPVSRRGQRKQTFLGAEEVASMFLSRFSDWEAEEIACVKDYMIFKYTGFLAECEKDLARDSPRFEEAFEESPATPNGCYDVSPGSIEYEIYRDRLVSLGLPLLAKMLQAQSHEERLDLITEGIQTSNLNSLNEALNIYRGEFEPIDEYAGHEIARGDRQVSPAWARIDGQGRGYESNNMKRADLRRWGYVMWDNPRLDIAGLQLEHGSG